MIVGLLGSTLDRAVNEWQNDCGPVRVDRAVNEWQNDCGPVRADRAVNEWQNDCGPVRLKGRTLNTCYNI